MKKESKESTKSENKNDAKECCEKNSCCCGVSHKHIADFLRHIADFFERKK